MAAKILMLDVETSPIIGYAWVKYDTNLIEIIEPFRILSFAYKWLGEETVFVKALNDYKSYKPDKYDDSLLMKDLHGLLDAADIIVTHNGDAFDIKKINTRLLVNGLKPPATYKTVDTLKVARKHFKFDSNKLNDLAQMLGIGKKVPHVGFALWKACMAGDAAAWEVMKEYNQQDVVLLEEIYLRLRPWAVHPDVSLYEKKSETPVCPSCGGRHIQRRGTAVAKTRKYQRLNCQDCGTWFSGALEK